MTNILNRLPTHFIPSSGSNPTQGSHEPFIPESNARIISSQDFHPPTIPYGGALVSIVEENKDTVVVLRHVKDFNKGGFQPSCMMVLPRTVFEKSSTTLPTRG